MKTTAHDTTPEETLAAPRHVTGQRPHARFALKKSGIALIMLAMFMMHCGETMSEDSTLMEPETELGSELLEQTEPEATSEDEQALSELEEELDAIDEMEWQDEGLDSEEADPLDDMVFSQAVAPPEPAEEFDPLQPRRAMVKTTYFGGFHWNIAGGKENGCKTQGIRRAVMRFVRESKSTVDFISLNEVCPSQFIAIRKALRTYWKKGPKARFDIFQGSGRSRVGSALFSRRNLRDITRQEVGQDKWGKRYLLCGLQEGRRVRVCTTHLTPGDSTARVQLKRVLTRLESWWKHREDTVIIGGDFNLFPNDRGFDAMYSANANTRNNPNNHGRYREWDDDDADNCKGYGQRTTPGTTRGPCREGAKIDFIFTRENRIVKDTYDARSLNIPTDCTGACSDHRPVKGIARIRFRTN